MPKSYEQQRDEFIAINTGTATPELIKEWISEREASILLYKVIMKTSDKKNHWKGKIGHKAKEIKALTKLLNNHGNNSRTN